MPTPPSHQRRLANVPLRISYGAYGDAAPAEADVGGDEQADAAVPDATEVPDAAGTEALKHTSQEMTGATDMDDPRSWLHNGAGRAMMMRAGWVAADFGESRQMRVWPGLRALRALVTPHLVAQPSPRSRWPARGPTPRAATTISWISPPPSHKPSRRGVASR
jgi:hypothetical protein